MNATDNSVEEERSRAIRGLRGRALAIVVALTVAGTLGAGWLADNLTVTPPATSQAAITRQIGFSTVTLTVSPAPLRANRAESLLLRVTDATGAAVDGAQLQCALSMPDMAMALPPVTATQTAQAGVYTCTPPPLAAGVWALDLTLRLPTGETGHAAFQLSAA